MTGRVVDRVFVHELSTVNSLIKQSWLERRVSESPWGSLLVLHVGGDHPNDRQGEEKERVWSFLG